jgi:two-component system nitrogen regulation response regulator GlnG
MKTMVWVVDDDNSIRWVMEKALEKADFSVCSFEDADSLLSKLADTTPDTIISDIRMPGVDGLELLNKIHNERPELPVIITTAHSDLESAVAAYEGGAFEYLPKPFDVGDLVSVTKRAIAFASEKATQTDQQEVVEPAEIIGEAPAMQEVFRAIGRLSQSNITVLIDGQSGTGKELVAKALHRHSPRKAAPFVAINMAAIPHDLIESELFGHEKGAFTGAAQRRIGHFEQAAGGTLFLDEIGDMPAEAQTRLLRVLAENEFFRVGGHTSVKADVRIIAATHQNLEQLVEAHRFREDLFHRINVIRIHLPKLADRREDLPKLMSHFFQQSAEELNVEVKSLSSEAEAFLVKQPWPGNVRQLENTCRWLTVMAAGHEILLSDLPPEMHEQPIEAGGSTTDWQHGLRHWISEELAQGGKNILATALPAFERAAIETALQHSAGRKREAAELLGWGRNTLTRKLQELDIQS